MKIYGVDAKEQEMSADLKVFTFGPEWGLPSSGPFALKLLAWLELAGIPYQQVTEGNPRKGPKGKNPWVELDGQRIGDSEVIIEILSRRHAVRLDEELSPEEQAVGHSWRRTFEEHFHQILEWELFFQPEGAAYLRRTIESQMPRLAGRAMFMMVRSHFRRQLNARGIGRHSPEIIVAKGQADLDALAAFLGDREFLLRDRPASADAAVFGLLAPMVYWTMSTPVADYAKSLETVSAYCDRMRALCFADSEEGSRNKENPLRHTAA